MDRPLPGDEDRLAPDRRLTARSERRQLSFVAILALVPFALLAVWARSWSPAPWEPGMVDVLDAGSGPLGQLSAAINFAGNVPVWAVVAAAFAVVLGLLRGAVAAILIAVSFASDLAAFVVKTLVERQRPDTAAAEQFFGVDDFSFPSGHTVRAAALVAVVVWLLAPPRWRVPMAVAGGVLAGAVMGYARVSLGVHWPTDTIGGALLGVGWFALTTLLIWFGLKQAQELHRTEG